MNEELKYEEILLELKEAGKLDIDEMEDAPVISYGGGYGTFICC